MMKKQDLVKLIREVISEVDYDDSVKTTYTVTAIAPEGKVDVVKTSRENEDLRLAPEKIELIKKYPETRDWKGLERLLGDAARHLPFSLADGYMYDFKIDDNKKNLTITASKGGSMTMKELRESIRTEIRRQIGVRGGMSEVISGRAGHYTIYYEFYDIAGFDGSVRTSEARFAPGQQGCQDFYDWWIEEFINVTNFGNLEEFGDIVFRTSNGVMAYGEPHGSFVVAIPAKLAKGMKTPTSIIGGDDAYRDIIARMAGVSTDEIEEVRVQSASQRFA